MFRCFKDAEFEEIFTKLRNEQFSTNHNPLAPTSYIPRSYLITLTPLHMELLHCTNLGICKSITAPTEVWNKKLASGVT